uniref:ADAMTS like 5 n=1 Tax=Oncorhynchus kisutch TaxID=8019 RepID=A0A8C7LEA8_ONCKI
MRGPAGTAIEVLRFWKKGADWNVCVVFSLLMEAGMAACSYRAGSCSPSLPSGHSLIAALPLASPSSGAAIFHRCLSGGQGEPEVFLGVCVGSFRGSFSACPTTAALQERMGLVEWLVRVLALMWGRGLCAYTHLHHQGCAGGSEDFREMQCSAYNDRPLVAGNSYRWTTFHGGSNPCELSCLAQGHNFYYNFGRVLDGTACSKEPGDVCVNGKCLTPGCDLILGSDQQEDACMVCGGQNSTCLHHRSVYQNAQGAAGPFGYNEVTMIPAGATHIRVTDNSRNYLALQNGRSQFVINGNWKISVPGEYSVAGTKLLYKRSVDTWESFEVPGPTMEDLHVMVLVTDRNPGIEYEYWLPPDRYALFHGRRSQLREPHHTASYIPWDHPHHHYYYHYYYY